MPACKITCQCCLWSLKYQDELLPSHELSFGVRCYKEKHSVNSDSSLTYHRSTALVERGCLVQPSGKVINKLKFSLPDFEHMLRNQDVVSYQWRTRLYIIIVFANRTFAHVYVNSETGDLEFMYIDASIQSKFNAEDEINDAVIAEQYYAFTFRHRNKLGIVSFNKALPVYFSGSKISKLSHFDPKLVFYDLPASTLASITFNWRIFANEDKNSLVAFAKPSLQATRKNTASQNAQTEIGATRVSNDLVIFTVSARGVAVEIGNYFLGTEIGGLKFTENGFTIAEVLTMPNTICNIRSFVIFAADQRNDVVGTVSLKGKIICCHWSPNGKYCAISSAARELRLWDTNTGKSYPIQTKIQVHFVCWNFSNLTFLAFSDKGEVQMFDIGGNLFQIGLSTETPQCSEVFNFRQFLRSPSVCVENIASCHKVELSLVEALGRAVQPHTKILVFLSRGPFIMFDFHTPKFTLKNLLQLRTVNADAAYEECFRVISRLTWNDHAEIIFFALSKVLKMLLSKPITFESEQAIDRALDCFYKPLNSGKILEVVSEEYTQRFHCYTVKYVQMLMRTGKLEKALEVSVNSNNTDSCMDVCHMALQLQEFELAKVARFHAESLLEDSEDADGISCLFPKIPEHSELGRDSGADAVGTLLIPTLDELENCVAVRNATVEEAFKGLYIVNDRIEDKDEGNREDKSDLEDSRSNNRNSSSFQFGIL